MTMEQQAFEDVSPIENGDLPACHVSLLGGVTLVQFAECHLRHHTIHGQHESSMLFMS